VSRVNAKARRQAESRGRWAERWVALLLLFIGYRCLAKRYRTPVGEIDLIASRGETLVMVEVKYRRALGFQRLRFEDVEKTAPSPAEQKRL
jgi:putative endonuclease